MTSILLAPTRETTLLARQVASLDAISGCRLSLGIGIGVRESDYLATGFDFHRRGRREEEQLAVLRRFLKRESVDVIGLRRTVAQAAENTGRYPFERR